MADGINSAQLMSGVERVERLDEEMAGLKEDQKGILEELKEKGLNPKYVKKIVAERKKDPEKRRIEDAEWEMYRQAADLD